MKIVKYEEKYLQRLQKIIHNDYEVGRISWFLDEYPKTSFVAIEGGNPVGVCVYGGDESPKDILVYVDEEYRRRGYGSELIEHAEKMAVEEGVDILELSCVNGTEERAFLKRHGYELDFTSIYMTYQGEKKPQYKYEIRPYKDEYYLEYRTVIREAFHKMQVLVGIEEEDCEYPPNEAQRKAFLEGAEESFAMFHNGEIVGALNLDDEEIEDIAVSPKHQGKGYGKELMYFAMNRILDENDTVELWCILNNPAEKFYEKLGFVKNQVHDITNKKLK